MASNRSAIEADINAALETIVDPCSAAAGAPVGLVSMGLVRDVQIRLDNEGAQVSITLALTEPGCMMGALFQEQARQRVGALDGVAAATVSIDYGYLWTPSDMAAGYQARLASHRRRQRIFMQQRR